MIRNSAWLILSLVFMASCIEEEIEIRVNEDGSGEAVHRLVFHPRANAYRDLEDIAELKDKLKAKGVELVSMKASTPEYGKHEFRFHVRFKRIQDYIDLELINMADLEFHDSKEGEFECRVLPTRPESQTMRFSGKGTEQEKTKKFVNEYEGAFLSLKIHLPRAVLRTETATRLKGGKGFHWSLDFRTPEARRKTAEFYLSKRKVIAWCSKEKLDWRFPIHKPEEEDSRIKVEDFGKPVEAKDFRVELQRISVNRTKSFVKEEKEPGSLKGVDRMELRFMVHLPMGVKVFGKERPVISKAKDDLGFDLNLDRDSIFSVDVNFSLLGMRHSGFSVDIELIAPCAAAKRLAILEGYIVLVVSRGTIVIRFSPGEVREKAWREHPLLKSMGFAIVGHNAESIRVKCHPISRIQSIRVIDEKGGVYSNRGYSGTDTERSYKFLRVPESFGLELEILDKVQRVKVPIKVENVEIP